MSVNVVILSDQPAMQASLTAMIQAEGASALVAGSLEAALDILCADVSPLVFAAELRRGPSGGEVCRAIRESLGGRDARLVFLAKDDSRLPEQLAAEGFDDVLRWPLDAGRGSMLVRSAARAAARRESGTADLLRRLSLDLAWSTTLSQQAHIALDTVRQACAPHGAALWLRDRRQGDVICARSFGLSADYVDTAAGAFRLLSGHQWVALSRRSEVVADAQHAPEPLGGLAAREGFGSVVTTALFTATHVLGALVVYFDGPCAPSDETVELLELVAATTAMAIDQTQLRVRLIAAESTHARLVEHMSDAVFTLDARGNLLATNPATADITGYEPGELEQLSIFDLLTAEDGERARALLARHASADEPVEPAHGAVTVVRADGRLIPGDLALHAVDTDESGAPATYQAVLRDTSTVTRMHRELRALQLATEIMVEERDLGAAVRAVAGALRSELGYTRGGIWTLSPDGRELIASATFGLHTEPRMSIERGVLGRVARTRRATLVPDVLRDPDYICGDEAVRSEVCVPILHGDRLVGIIDVEGDEARPVADEDLAFGQALATVLASSIERAELYREIERQARTDAVTGLPNRQALQQTLAQIVAEAAGQPVSLLIAGADGFKKVHDTYGDLVSDDVLNQLAQVLNARVRPGQFIARYIGDTFAIILPGTSREDAVGIAEGLRIPVAMQLFIAAEQVEQLTVSIGAATYPDDASDATELLLAANHAMYLAKQAGRNQVFQSNAALAELAPAYGRINDLLRQSPSETLALLVRAIDQRLPGRAGHADRVSRYAMRIAEHLGLPEEDRSGLRLAAIVHDVGMLSLPDSLLRKPGSLSREEKELLRGVPLVAQGLLSQLDLPPIVLPAVVHQHERWDGSGYPDGLAGEDIPLGARIIAVADALDALTSPRAHREPLPMDQALDLLRRAAGSHFDPAVVDAAAAIAGEPLLERVGTGPLGPKLRIAPADLTRNVALPA